MDAARSFESSIISQREDGFLLALYERCELKLTIGRWESKDN